MQFIVQRNKKSQVKHKSLLLISINYVYGIGEALKKKKNTDKICSSFYYFINFKLSFQF